MNRPNRSNEPLAAVSALPGSKPITEVRADDPDGELVRSVRQGEREAFNALVRRHQRAVFALALRYVRHEADAQDLVQKTFVRALGALDRFRGDSSFRTWLFRIAINLCKNHLRDRKREIGEAIDDPDVIDAEGPQRLIDRERADRLRRAVAKLPNKQRTVLELRIYHELPFRDVADLAECTENAAKVNFHYAVKKLRSLLASFEEALESES